MSDCLSVFEGSSWTTMISWVALLTLRLELLNKATSAGKAAVFRLLIRGAGILIKKRLISCGIYESIVILIGSVNYRGVSFTRINVRNLQHLIWERSDRCRVEAPFTFGATGSVQSLHQVPFRQKTDRGTLGCCWGGSDGRRGRWMSRYISDHLICWPSQLLVRCITATSTWGPWLVQETVQWRLWLKASYSLMFCYILL